MKNTTVNEGHDRSSAGVTLKTARWLRRRAENLGAAMLAGMFIAFLIQIFFRYVLNLPVGWTTEVCTIAWLWGILWGSSFVIPESAEIRFDIVYSAVSPATRRVFRVITGIGLIALYLIALPQTISYIIFMKVESTSYTGIRFDYLFFMYVVFVGATVSRYCWITWHALRGTPESRTDPEMEEEK